MSIPSGVSIGDYAFADCDLLTNLTLALGVATLGQGVFSDCASLTSVRIPASVTTISSAAALFDASSRISTQSINSPALAGMNLLFLFR
jgi:hypothetical protein